MTRLVLLFLLIYDSLRLVKRVYKYLLLILKTIPLRSNHDLIYEFIQRSKQTFVSFACLLKRLDHYKFGHLKGFHGQWIFKFPEANTCKRLLFVNNLTYLLHNYFGWVITLWRCFFISTLLASFLSIVPGLYRNTRLFNYLINLSYCLLMHTINSYN